MTRAEVRELHFITHVDNVPSILEHGILSNHGVARLGVRHTSVAMAEVQSRRRKQVPGGRLLHDYANLYLNARNPMMYRKTRIDGILPAQLVVLRVDPRALDLPNAVIADKNASSDYVMFSPSPDGLATLAADLVYTESWNSDDPIEKMRRKSAICAEVLVPNSVAPNLIVGVYVSCAETAGVVQACARPGARLDIAINPHIFFM
jgi:hypothetical protein